MSTLVITTSSLLRNTRTNLEATRVNSASLRQVTTGLGNKRLPTAKSIVFPYGPVDVTYDSIGSEYVAIDRPGTKALLEKNADKLITISFSAIIANKSSLGAFSIEKDLTALRAMASEDIPVKFVHGISVYPADFKITEMGYKSLARTRSGEITQAEVTLQLTEYIAVNPAIVRLSPISYKPSATVKKTTSKTTSTNTSSKTGNGDDNITDFTKDDLLEGNSTGTVSRGSGGGGYVKFT